MTGIVSPDQPLVSSWQRYVGWLLIALLFGYITNNFLEIYLGLNNPKDFRNVFTVSGLVGTAIYVTYIVLALWKVKKYRTLYFLVLLVAEKDIF